MGPYDYYNRGIDQTMLRSESTDNELARRQLAANPPVTVLGSLLGALNPAQGQVNSLVDAIRMRALQKMMETGGPAVDNWGYTSTYGQPK